MPTQTGAQSALQQLLQEELLTPTDPHEAQLLEAAAQDPAGAQLAQVMLAPLPGRQKLDAAAIEARREADFEAYREKADAILEHRVELLGGYGVQDLGDPIDWYHAPDGDLQWPTHLSRHYWLEPAAWMYRWTGETRYADAVIEILLDWHERQSIWCEQLEGKPGAEGWSRRWNDQDQPPTLREAHFKGYCDGPWTALSSHRRCESWTQIFALLHDAPGMTNERIAPLLLSLGRVHLQQMIEYPRQMNQYLAIACSLAELQLDYPLFERADEAGRVGWGRVKAWVQREIYPDGSAAECSPNYALGCALKVFNLTERASAAGLDYPPAVDERLRAALRYMAYYLTPAGQVPRIAKGKSFISKQLAQLNERYQDAEAARLITPAAQRSEAPQSELARVYPWAGHVVMRDGWGPEATWVFFEPGPRGSGHADNAQLNLQLFSGGQWLLTDSGYHTYSQAGPLGHITAYMPTSAAHNVGLVDGHGQVRGHNGPNEQPGDYGFADEGNLVRAEGTYTHGFGPNAREAIAVTHHRALCFDRAANTLRIVDTFTGDGEHAVALHWQLPSESDPTLGENGASYSAGKVGAEMRFEGENELRVDAVRGQDDPPLGWFSADYGHLVSAPTLRVQTRGSLPIRIETTLAIKR